MNMVERGLDPSGGHCLSEPGLATLHAKKRPTVRGYLITGWGKVERSFFVTKFHGDTEFADTVTGTIYKSNGRAAGGNPHLTMELQ